MIPFAVIEGPDQTARMRKLIRALPVRVCPKTCFHMAWHIKSLILFKQNRQQCPVVDLDSYFYVSRDMGKAEGQSE